MDGDAERADNSGHYSVLLGSTKPDGLPGEIFAAEQARWIGVQIERQPEQTRALLVATSAEGDGAPLVAEAGFARPAAQAEP